MPLLASTTAVMWSANAIRSPSPYRASWILRSSHTYQRSLPSLWKIERFLRQFETGYVTLDKVVYPCNLLGSSFQAQFSCSFGFFLPNFRGQSSHHQSREREGLRRHLANASWAFDVRDAKASREYPVYIQQNMILELQSTTRRDLKPLKPRK